jgi:hypothetical protein
MGALVWLALTPIRTVVPRAGLLALLTVVATLCALVDFGVLRRPATGRQVPATWLRRYGPVRSYGLYGIVLGAGLLTHVPHALTYLTFAALGLLLPAHLAVLVGALFGIARSFVIGPAAPKAELASKLLFRSRGSQLIWPKVSAVVSLAVVLGTVASIVE